jgi:hypothetical protein
MKQAIDIIMFGVVDVFSGSLELKDLGRGIWPIAAVISISLKLFQKMFQCIDMFALDSIERFNAFGVSWHFENWFEPWYLTKII